MSSRCATIPCSSCGWEVLKGLNDEVDRSILLRIHVSVDIVGARILALNCFHDFGLGLVRNWRRPVSHIVSGDGFMRLVRGNLIFGRVRLAVQDGCNSENLLGRKLRVMRVTTPLLVSIPTTIDVRKARQLTHAH